MDDRFRPVYEKLYRSYANAPQALAGIRARNDEAAKVIAEIIDEAQRELKNRQSPPLREDAQYFMLLRLFEMVYLPITEEAYGTINPPRLNQLAEGFSQDVRTLAYSASDEALRRNERLVSSHTLIDTLHNSWNKLNSAVGRVWEKQQT